MEKFPLPIVCFSTEDWDTRLPTNKKQIMSRLADTGTQVIWIDTVGTRLPKFKPTDIARIWRRIWAKTNVNKHSSFHRISPLVIPGGPASINRPLLRRKITSTLKKLNITDYALWIYNPYASDYIEDLPKPDLIIYHCVDDLSLVPGARGKAIQAAEKKVLKMSDLVFCTSPALLEKCKALNENSSLQSNVADYIHFSKAGDPGFEIPDNLKALRKEGPIIAFAGNLVEYKIDFGLIIDAAYKMPQAEFVLIGPEWEGNQRELFHELESCGNVHFTGLIEYDALPRHLAAADVLMMPYRLTDHTKNIFPLKFFEFMATGKPVVSTALPALAEYKDIVPLTLNSDEFVKALEDALSGAQDPHRDDRINLARQNTWESRISCIIDSVKKCLRDKN